jgi:hypothetical protein
LRRGCSKAKQSESDGGKGAHAHLLVGRKPARMRKVWMHEMIR